MRRLRAVALLSVVIVMAASALAVDVGDSRLFWVWDLSVMPPEDVQLSATCRGVGDYAYVFVEDDAWDAGEMDADDVEVILSAFEDETPPSSYDSERGIYEIETELFGMPTDVDDDLRIYLLYYNLQCYEGTCFDGFFRYEDLSPGEHSNYTEMLHMNIQDNDPTSEYMMGIIAHEFNHMIHVPKDPDDELWVHESLAEAAMVACGYLTDVGWLNSYLNDSDVSFWGDVHSINYGAAMLLGTYLYEVLGAGNISDVIDDPANGIAGIENSLEQHSGLSFGEFFGSLALAILLDEEGGAYGFDLLDFNAPAPAYSVSKTDVQIDRTVGAGSIHFVHFGWYDADPSPFFIRFEQGKALGDLWIFIVRYEQQGVTVVPVDVSAEPQQQDDEATSVELVIANPHPVESVSYSYTVVTEGVDGDDDDDDGGGYDYTDDEDSAGCGCSY